MEKSTTLNLRVNPAVKERAETVLSALGIPMSTAIDMYLNQIYLTGGIPFAVTLPKAPDGVNADIMTQNRLEEKLMHGIDEAKAGKTHDAAKAFDDFRKSRRT